MHLTLRPVGHGLVERELAVDQHHIHDPSREKETAVAATALHEQAVKLIDNAIDQPAFRT